MGLKAPLGHPQARLEHLDFPWKGGSSLLGACREFTGWGLRDMREEREEDRSPFLIEMEIPLMKIGMERPSQGGPQRPWDGTGKKGVRVGDLA